MKLKIKAVSDKIGKDIPYPFYATAGAAAMDLCACVDAPVEVAPRALVSIPTGIAIALPSAEYVALVFARSGLGIKHGIALSNGVGVIDSDYRGEIRVGLTNLSDTPYTVQPGDRIAQLAVMPVVQAELERVDSLDDTGRGLTASRALGLCSLKASRGITTMSWACPCAAWAASCASSAWTACAWRRASGTATEREGTDRREGFFPAQRNPDFNRSHSAGPGDGGGVDAVRRCGRPPVQPGGDPYPAGLVAGHVEEVRTDASGMTRYAVIAPETDLDGLQQVFVITDFTVNE